MNHACLTGLRVALASLLIHGLLFSTASLAGDEQWSTLGSGASGTVHALVADGGGNVYAGGTFLTAGGVTVNRVAKWDGSSWHALGSGMSNTVYALALDGNGNLYAGGTFTSAGGVAANRVAKWNGSIWSAVGSGTNGAVYALTVDGSDQLYAGGAFVTAGGSTVNRIARWNGSSWSALGSGISTCPTGICAEVAVKTLAIGPDNITVYAGGMFGTAGGVGSVACTAKWSGSSWSAVGSGLCFALYQTVSALAVAANGDVYAGGNFGADGGDHIARWNGSSWVSVGTGMGNTVLALQWGGDRLYAGGTFTTAGSVSASRIAQWNGSSWSALASGTNNTVNALALDPAGRLFAGGAFTVAGGQASPYLAQWLIDTDNDGTPDINDAFPLDPAEWLDTDNDSIGNNADPDDDNDGIPDGIDADPLNASVGMSLNGIYKGSTIKDTVKVQ